MNKLNTFCIPLIAGTLGSLTTGCLPPGNSNVARFDTASYSPNTDSSGFSGAWILTFNNEYVNPDYVAHYERQLVRLAPVEGAPDTYELTNCNAGSEVTHSTVQASGNTITVSIDGTSYAYSMTTDGRMTAPIYYGNGNVWGTWRAVRVSSNPDFNAGTVGLDFATDDRGTVKLPAACFSEAFNTAPDYPESDDYQLGVAGEGDGGIVKAYFTQQPFGSTWLIGGDNMDGYISGPLLNDINTLQSTVQGIRGTAITTGDAPDPTTAGSLVVNVKL